MAFKKLSENLIYSEFKQGETHNLHEVLSLSNFVPELVLIE